MSVSDSLAWKSLKNHFNSKAHSFNIKDLISSKDRFEKYSLLFNEKDGDILVGNCFL